MKKCFIFTITFIVCLLLLSISANAEIVDWPVSKYMDRRHGYTVDEVLDWQDMRKRFHDTVIEEELYFSTKETELCKYMVPDRDGLWMSREVEPNSSGLITPGPSEINWGFVVSTEHHQEFAYPYKQIEEKLLQAYPDEEKIIYVIDENFHIIEFDPTDIAYKTYINIDGEYFTIHISVKPNAALTTLSDVPWYSIDNLFNFCKVYALELILFGTSCCVFGIAIYVFCQKRKLKNK